MPRSKPPSSPATKQVTSRMAIWKHNSFHGHARMAETNMASIISSHTATSEAKTIAGQILILAKALRKSLIERVE